jgi:hypothetical protein
MNPHEPFDGLPAPMMENGGDGFFIYEDVYKLASSHVLRSGRIAADA